MEIKITGTPGEIKKLLDAMGGSKERLIQDVNGRILSHKTI